MISPAQIEAEMAAYPDICLGRRLVARRRIEQRMMIERRKRERRRW